MTAAAAWRREHDGIETGRIASPQDLIEQSLEERWRTADAAHAEPPHAIDYAEDPPVVEDRVEAADQIAHEEPLWGPHPPGYTYLAGPAGSGKTFAIKAWAERAHGLAICATTGIAAINVGGTTINALLGYFDTKSLMESYTSGFLTARLGRLWKAGVRRLVLDEVSMLDGDQLTYLVRAIDELNTRGYVLTATRDDDDDAPPPAMGLTLVGDFAQLAPVKAPFAWESAEWRRTDDNQADRFAESTITLTTIRRQADQAFIEALRAARVGDGAGALAYFAPLLQPTTDEAFEGPTIFATNKAVDRFNWLRLDRITGRSVIFDNDRWGKQRSEWGDPKKDPHTWGIPIRLQLKIGVLVMILSNKRVELGTRLIYANGDLGTLVDLDEARQVAIVRLQRNGTDVEVDYVEREVLTPLTSARRKQLKAEGKDELISEDGRWEIEGWIDYMPLRVAYASTVHKSQGLSLDRVQINIRDGFFKAPGMVYVALSRARTAEGLRVVGDRATFVDRCNADPRLKDWL